ncbi:MAG: MFS transporter [Planctomycetes bacterium]|nr:MFS transporter [Planctomycetota bacterium]
MSPLDRQLRLLRAYALLTYPFACVPFLFLWFHRHGMDEGDYGEIVGAYYLAMFLAEVPTGVLADRFGCKRMLVFGPLLLAAGFGLLLGAPGYAGFVAGEVLLGLGHAVLSGPPSTILYETLREHGEQRRYLAEESRMHARRLLGTGGSFLLGGTLARIGAPSGDAWHLTIAATCVLCAGAAVVAMRLAPEPARGVFRVRKFFAELRTDLTRPPLIWLLSYWAVLFTLLRYPFHNYQPWLRAAGSIEPLLLDPLFVGALFAAMNFAAAPLSSAVPRLVHRLGRRPLFWAMPLVLCASLVVMAWERHAAEAGTGSRALAWLAVAMFFVQQVPFGMHMALLQDFVNHRIGPAARTTVLSAVSLVARSCYAVCNVALFHAQLGHGMAWTLWWTGVAGAAATAIVLWIRPRGVLRGETPIA